MAYPTGELSVDLHAIAENWQIIKNQLKPDTQCGAVVKANAYGLGVDRIAPKLYATGCRDFFVSNFKEAQQLKALIGSEAKIFVLTGCNAGAEEAFIRNQFIPVLVSVEMLERWAAYAEKSSNAEAALKINTGMGRLGLEPLEFEKLVEHKVILEQAKIQYLMSHFACADEPGHSLNNTQMYRFEKYLEVLKHIGIEVQATLANSAGVFLSLRAHHDIVRPGIALYGGNPGQPQNPMRPVVSLKLPVIQVRHLPAGEFVGYGATLKFDEDRYLAVVSGGYADGLLRSLSGKGWGFLLGCKVPIVGRVSMDSTIFDITEVVQNNGIPKAASIELLGANVTIDDMGQAAGTISYEVLTSLGSRYQRAYHG
ncbi:MAG: alanine racemase [Agarilytica sp.]